MDSILLVNLIKETPELQREIFEYFEDALRYCELPTKQEILGFLQELGFSGTHMEIKNILNARLQKLRRDDKKASASTSDTQK